MLKFVGGFSCRVLFFAMVLLHVCGDAQAKNRVALVIGNSNYANTGSLKNPVNDANLMAKSLTKAGFNVTKILDADYKTIKRAMLNFGRELRKGPDAGLFYYAGHGVQIRGENFLVPVNAKIADEDEIDLEAININSFLQVMNSSNSSINIVVLDACRNNPFSRSFRSVGRGLAPVDAPKGTYIAYATSPGDVAADGDGKNSPYSAALAKAIEIPGIPIEQVFKRARKSVLDITDSKQVPWETSSITGEFYFFPQSKASQNTVTSESEPIDNSSPVDLYKEWQRLSFSENIGELQKFSDVNSGTKYAFFAENRVIQLRRGEEGRLNLLWRELSTSRNQGALAKFIKKYSGTKFANYAANRIVQLKRVEATNN